MYRLVSTKIKLSVNYFGFCFKNFENIHKCCELKECFFHHLHLAVIFFSVIPEIMQQKLRKEP